MVPGSGPQCGVAAPTLECGPGVRFPPSIPGQAKWKAMGIAEKIKENGSDSRKTGRTSLWTSYSGGYFRHELETTKDCPNQGRLLTNIIFWGACIPRPH